MQYHVTRRVHLCNGTLQILKAKVHSPENIIAGSEFFDLALVGAHGDGRRAEEAGGLDANIV